MSAPDIHFSYLHYQDLSASQLYEYLRLRQEVFIVEQNCSYLDCDNKDQLSWHLEGRVADGTLVAYTRLLPPGVAYQDFASIGRVLTHPNYRRHGFGRPLMRESLRLLAQLCPQAPIRIGAQSYLEQFYTHLGFRPIGQDYMEDGIPHMKMDFMPDTPHNS